MPSSSLDFRLNEISIMFCVYVVCVCVCAIIGCIPHTADNIPHTTLHTSDRLHQIITFVWGHPNTCPSKDSRLWYPSQAPYHARLPGHAAQQERQAPRWPLTGGHSVLEGGNTIGQEILEWSQWHRVRLIISQTNQRNVRSHCWEWLNTK